MCKKNQLSRTNPLESPPETCLRICLSPTQADWPRLGSAGLSSCSRAATIFVPWAGSENAWGWGMYIEIIWNGLASLNTLKCKLVYLPEWEVIMLPSCLPKRSTSHFHNEQTTKFMNNACQSFSKNNGLLRLDCDLTQPDCAASVMQSNGVSDVGFFFRDL